MTISFSSGCWTSLLIVLHVLQASLWFQHETELGSLRDSMNLIVGQTHDRGKRDTNGHAQDLPPSKGDVEFIHPKLREEMDLEPEDPNNPWVWLTSYSRIPVEAIQDFCAATKEYCPPGKPGPKGDSGDPGIPGLKGKRGRPGRVGSKGTQGHRGPIGPPGPRGEKGMSGMPGMQGLDGRDGLPGEPGLDGVPGRNGLDGVPGVDGIPGLPGSPGVPGINGKDGEKGMLGPKGPRGSVGERGLPGPRGRMGKEGQDGLPGEPGISVWKVENKEATQLLIPPKISGGKFDEKQKIIVREGDHLKLTCAASGVPKPIVTWRKQDGNAFPDGAWRKSNTLGAVLNITRISRKHMGVYLCEANNGIPPATDRQFEIEVHFAPLIRIHRQMVGGYNGSFTTIECTIEAFPNAVNYWERHDGRIIQEHPGKYEINIKEYGGYKASLKLNLSLSEPADFGAYYCISKNEKGLTKGGITIFERDPNSALPPPIIGGYKPAVIGEEPPAFVGLDDLCPPSPKCPDCQAVRCEGSARMYGLTILPYESSLPGLPNRTQECMVETIGKPVFHRYSGDLFGAWMMDASEDAAEQETDRKIWTTSSSTNQTLYEFANKTMYRAGVPTKNYSLPLPFSGNDHVVYNGSFFYFHLASESVVKFDLYTKFSKKLKIPRNRVVVMNGGELLTKLYKPQHEDNYFDLNTDENGLWGVFGLALDNNTVVMKFDSATLEVQYMWNISINHHQIADSFIICGVLYAVDDVDERNTRIRFALDLYKNKLLDIELPFSNPFSYTTMLGYNGRLQSLTTWDGGNQLTYPIKYHAIGYRETYTEEEVDDTGYSLTSAGDEEGENRLKNIDLL